MNIYREDLFKFFSEHSELLEHKYFSWDLLPHLPNPQYTLPPLTDLLDNKEVIFFMRCGYNGELRENRFWTILVDEFARLKNDYKEWKEEGWKTQ